MHEHYTLYLCVMNKNNILFLIAFFLMSVPCFAQFITIGDHVSNQIIGKSKEIKNYHTKEKINVPPNNQNWEIGKGTSVDTAHYMRQQNIDVSYPLKKIKVISPYGMRKDPMTGIYKKHNGVDLRARKAMVYSMFPGIVHKVGYDERSGNYVIIHHGEIAVSYCHLSKILIIKGSRVHAHEVIGISGNTGRSTGEHLHVTCKMKGTYINPEIIFQYIRNILDSSENDK